VAVFGSAEDDRATAAGRIPALNRKLLLQRPTNTFKEMREKLSMDDIFLGLKASGKNSLKTARPDFEDSMSTIAKSTRDPRQIRILAKAEMAGKEDVELGIFAETKTSICTSTFSQDITQVDGKESEILKVSSFCMIRLRDYVVSIIVTSAYSSPDDLAWTRKVSVAYRDRLLELNP